MTSYEWPPSFEVPPLPAIDGDREKLVDLIREAWHRANEEGNLAHVWRQRALLCEGQHKSQFGRPSGVNPQGP